MRHPEEIRSAVGRRLAHLSDPQAQFAGEDENSLLHGKIFYFLSLGSSVIFLSWA